jgi:hypothetical protein
MGRIWRQAQKAIVWLGEELDSAGAINWLHVLALTKTWCDRARLWYVSDAKFNAQWQALQNLLLRPWWTRAWTLQEFVIAPELKFYCGRKSIRRSRFKSAMYVIWLCEGMNHMYDAWIKHVEYTKSIYFSIVLRVFSLASPSKKGY